ncbi:YihY/virulence factor BrkB family protein [Isoptericola sp. b441]|uniref:YihY/virulence factor BrkB family protein n=1 Tax=Actinotalea lenta TaxID=3064654 RepID=A0ABT9D7Y2_9CELL|nr:MULTISPECIES: YihY/virulence factor BrkB family protein [unclassified Isoptericola]MDO8106979.1 YihY/virulence factor BrkB family protein [Isoptericola sp. b441]MDO8121311.1 YihY/virulence factor BrkB family protein [Isoptericola sp. b490]
MKLTRDRVVQAVLPAEHREDRRAQLWRLTVSTATDTMDDRVPGLAAEMAFFAVLSLPPLLLAILGSVGFVLDGLDPGQLADLEHRILDGLTTFLSQSTVDQVLATPIHHLLRQGRSDVLSLGILLTLWSASRSANVLLRTVVIAYDQTDRRPIWKRRLVALTVTLVGVVTAVAGLPLLVIGPRLTADVVTALHLDPGLSRFWPVLFWTGVVAVVLVALTWLYHVAPGWHTPWHRDLPGAVLALGLWLLAGLGLRVYTSTFATFAQGDTYAGLAAPLVLLLWVYVTAIAVLLGAELNAEIEKAWPTITEEDRR